ncbi:hypothetical protein [Dipodfec virus RodF1_56]|uniref:Uncharacterized protein n=1 Tax=Dipodfec virus RodF1_56 TaxID=2929303 RepID=A0A976R8D4_9VIRU|nr:hypothetical protein [Dipodfec virus RodF1_56]
MGAKKDYSVIVDRVEVFYGPIRTATLVYKSFEKYFLELDEFKLHSISLSFKI